jgi:ABC-type nitrate/sulfonate/bicarbonate transport system permease component
MIKHLRKWLPPFLFMAVLLCLWEAAVHLFAIESWILPAPSAIWSELVKQSPRLGGEVTATTWVALSGLGIGVIGGVLIASLLHLFPLLERATYPLIVLSQNIPIIALAPLLVLWFGFGVLPKLIIVALVCFFPVTIATLDGFRQTDPILARYLQVAGASRLQFFCKLEWPSALPSFFSGLKLSATYSVMGAVISEWLGAEEGLGLMMTTASTSFRTDRVFVAIVLIVVLSMLLFVLITLLEKWVLKNRNGKGGEHHGKTSM